VFRVPGAWHSLFEEREVAPIRAMAAFTAVDGHAPISAELDMLSRFSKNTL
jgi:hypothetical protein